MSDSIAAKLRALYIRPVPAPPPEPLYGLTSRERMQLSLAVAVLAEHPDLAEAFRQTLNEAAGDRSATQGAIRFRDRDRDVWVQPDALVDRWLLRHNNPAAPGLSLSAVALQYGPLTPI